MAESEKSKPRVLVLGGCGFIGRHLVTYLLDNQLVSYVRVVDKVPPAMAWLSPKQKKSFENPLLEFRSANLLSIASRENAFLLEDGEWDYVFNLAAETKPNQSFEVYYQGIVPLSIECAKLAAKLGVKRFVELSDGHFTVSTKEPATESDDPQPYTVFAQCKIEVEKELSKIEDLDYVIARPAVVYGIGDRVGLTPWLILGAIYKHLGEPLRLLWHSNMQCNTVHVTDICRALWHLCTSQSVKPKQVYHIVDNGDTKLGDLAELIANIFEIKFNFVGKTLSTLAKHDIQNVVEEANDTHVPPWAEMCRLSGIENTPLTPYATVENLIGRRLWLNNSKLTNETKFEISIPKPTTTLLKEVIQDFTSMKLFPAVEKK